MLFSRIECEASEGNVAVVVQCLEDGLLSCGRSRSRGARGGRGNVVERVSRRFGRKKFHVLNDDVHRRALYALVILVISQLNAAADGATLLPFLV